MQHWAIDSDPDGLPGWHEAFPGLMVVPKIPPMAVSATPGVVWCRLRATDELADILAPIDFAAGSPVVVLCDEPSEILVMQALAAGATGCCNSRAAPEVLRQVAVVVSHGGLWVGQALLQRLVGSTSKLLAQRDKDASREAWIMTLSKRERQVAKLVGRGLSNREVADQLHISERTAKAHISAIFEKTGVRDRLQLSLKINGLEFQDI